MSNLPAATLLKKITLLCWQPLTTTAPLGGKGTMEPYHHRMLRDFCQTCVSNPSCCACKSMSCPEEQFTALLVYWLLCSFHPPLLQCCDVLSRAEHSLLHGNQLWVSALTASANRSLLAQGSAHESMCISTIILKAIWHYVCLAEHVSSLWGTIALPAMGFWPGLEY